MVPNQYLIGRINSAIIAATSTITADSPDPRSELESHDNMLVFGNKCFVFDSVHGRTVDVAPFDPSLVSSKKTQFLMPRYPTITRTLIKRTYYWPAMRSTSLQFTTTLLHTS